MAIQLHLGCGKRRIPGFLHVDLDDHPHIDYRSSIDKLPMFADESASLIYCSHALQYFDRPEALGALREWFRILQPGGRLRLSVSDFEALIEVYRRTGDLKRILGPLFGRIEIQAPEGARLLYMRTAYDFRALEELCRDAGYSSFQRYDWRETIHSDYDDFSQAYFPHMDKEHGLAISLNVEAVKGTLSR
ncbi:MAG TPA: methyltransferase domain-containing protein [Bryobacteraceae bacterium]|nr:methyltransferase domain-containing protein [Bryobacteraceae bacterium]